MKHIFYLLFVAMIVVSPCKADEGDFMLAEDSLTSLGYTTACLNHLPKKPMDTVKFFSAALGELDRKFLGAFGVTLTAISQEVMHTRPWEYVIIAEEKLISLPTQERAKLCLRAKDKLESVVAGLTRKELPLGRPYHD